MRNFTGSAEFDDTLPLGDGRLEAGLRVEPAKLAEALSAWLTQRGKGNGRPVRWKLFPNEIFLTCPAYSLGGRSFSSGIRRQEEKGL